MQLDRASLRRVREAVVQRHMESENVHDFDTAIATFAHPHYELVATGAAHDGEAAVRALECRMAAFFLLEPGGTGLVC